MMKHNIVVTISVAMLSSTMYMQAQIKYPETKRENTSDEYFGVVVADPYRWLENENSAETVNWVTQQNKVTRAYLDEVPFRTKIRERLTRLWDYEKISVPFKKGDYYLQYKNTGKQNQSVLYIRKGYEGAQTVLLNPNTFSADGTSSLSVFSVSNDHKYAAYGVSKAGSDWNEFYVIDLPSGTKRKDKLEQIKFSGAAWYKDGFFYSRFEKPEEGKALSQRNSGGKLLYHKIGEEQKNDKLVYEDPQHPTRMFGANVTEDERYLFLSVSESTSGNELYFKSLGGDITQDGFTPIYQGFEFDFSLIDHIDGKFFIHTNHGAPKYRVISVDPQNPGEEHWQTLIPETDDVLQQVHVMGNKLVLQYLSQVKSKLITYDWQTQKTSEFKLPGVGMVSGFSSKKEDSEAFFSFTGFTDPGSLYRYDDKTDSFALINASACDFITEEYETVQEFYTSSDGTQIPLFITRKKGLDVSPETPCYLYGYGGFNISVTPSFSPNVALFLEQGGIYAVANIRGGGEFGTEWHKAGTILQKQNVFDDFIAAAQYLIDKGLTSPEKLAISGRSNGGLLVGACMTQRPDLFKVALPGVGVLDMLRYHKFTIGYAWATDYGTSENAEEFDYLLKYSPVHNVKPGVYPATLVYTADHDDRVVPAHSYKFISELQHKQEGDNPVLIRIDVNAGHGAGKPLSKTIDEWTDIWTFVFRNLGMEMK